MAKKILSLEDITNIDTTPQDLNTDNKPTEKSKPISLEDLTKDTEGMKIDYSGGTQGAGTDYDPLNKYDEGLVQGVDQNYNRAEIQTGLEQVANRAARFVPAVAMDIAEQVGYLADFQGYSNALGITKGEVGNWFSDMMKEGSEKWAGQMPVYHKKPDALFDLTDSASWIDAGFDIGESLASFFATGAGVGKVLGSAAKGLSQYQKAQKLYSQISKGRKAFNALSEGKQAGQMLQAGEALGNIGASAAQFGTSTALGYSAGIMNGSEVFDKVVADMSAQMNFDGTPKYTEEEINNKAGEAAAATVRGTMAVQMFTNISTLGPLFRPMKKNAVIDKFTKEAASKGLGAPVKGTNDMLKYLKQIRGDKAQWSKAENAWVKMFKPEGLGFEMAQEGFEEYAENIAQQHGEVVGGIKKDIDWASDEALLATALGMAGGAMGKGMMSAIERSSQGESVEETAKRTFQEAVDARIDIIEKLTDLNKAAKKAGKDNDPVADAKIKQDKQNTITLGAIQTGADEFLKAQYEDILSMSAEEAQEAGLETNEKAAEYYKKVAEEGLENLAQFKDMFEAAQNNEDIPAEFRKEYIAAAAGAKASGRAASKLAQTIESKIEASFNEEFVTREVPLGMQEYHKANLKLQAAEALYEKWSKEHAGDPLYDKELNRLGLKVVELRGIKQGLENEFTFDQDAKGFSLTDDNLIRGSLAHLVMHETKSEVAKEEAARYNDPAYLKELTQERNKAKAYKEKKQKIDESINETIAALEKGSKDIELSKAGNITKAAAAKATQMGMMEKISLIENLKRDIAKLNKEDQEDLQDTLEKLEETVKKGKDKFTEYNNKVRKKAAKKRAKRLKVKRDKQLASIQEEAERQEQQQLAELENRKSRNFDYDNYTLPELFLSPEDVIAVVYKDQEGTLTIDDETGEYIFNDKIIVAGSQETKTLEELGIYVSKQGHYEMSFQQEGDVLALEIGKHTFDISNQAINEMVSIDENGTFKVTLTKPNGEKVVFNDQAMAATIADKVLVYERVLEDFMNDIDNNIATRGDKEYVITYNPLNFWDSKVQVYDKNGNLKEILKGKSARKANGQYTIKGELINQLQDKFNNQVIGPIIGKQNEGLDTLTDQPVEGQRGEEEITTDEAVGQGEVSVEAESEEELDTEYKYQEQIDEFSDKKIWDLIEEAVEAGIIVKENDVYKSPSGEVVHGDLEQTIKAFREEGRYNATAGELALPKMETTEETAARVEPILGPLLDKAIEAGLIEVYENGKHVVDGNVDIGKNREAALATLDFYPNIVEDIKKELPTTEAEVIKSATEEESPFYDTVPGSNEDAAISTMAEEHEKLLEDPVLPGEGELDIANAITSVDDIEDVTDEDVTPKGTINVYWQQAESEESTKILSNLAPREFTWEGRVYGSVEHAYQSNKSGTFDDNTYYAYTEIDGYGKKIRGKGTVAELKAADSLGLMKNLVVESFLQNSESDGAKKLVQYENFTHNTNELIDQAFLEGLVLAREALLKSKPAKKTVPAKGLEATVAEIVGNKDFIVLSEDGKNYVNTRTGQVYERVTSFIGDGKDITSNPILESSQTIGTKIDELVRDYFDDSLKPLSEYDVAEEGDLVAFLEDLKGIKKDMDARGEKVLANDIVLYNDQIGVAGTVDLLTYDAKGNFRIYDMKTMRGNQFTDTHKSGDNVGKTKYDHGYKKGQDSNKVKHQKQLSLYRILLNNTHGVKAISLAVIPMEIMYQGGDTSTDTLNLLPNVPVTPLEEVKTARLADSAKEDRGESELRRNIREAKEYAKKNKPETQDSTTRGTVALGVGKAGPEKVNKTVGKQGEDVYRLEFDEDGNTIINKQSVVITDLISNPNLGVDTEVTFEVIENSYWEDNKGFYKGEEHTQIPIFVKAVNPDTGKTEYLGQLKAADPKYNAVRKVIYDNYLKGEETKGNLSETGNKNYQFFGKNTSSNNIRNRYDVNGQPVFHSAHDAFSTAWVAKGDGTFELSNEAPITLVVPTGGVGSEGNATTSFFTAGLGSKMADDLTVNAGDLDEKLIGKEGLVYAVVVNPSGNYMTMQMQTPVLKENEVQEVLKNLEENKVDNANEIAFLNYDSDQSDMKFFMQFKENTKTGKSYIKFKEGKRILSVDQDEYAANPNSVTVSVEEGQGRGKGLKKTSTKIPNYDAKATIEKLLRKKRREVNKERLRDPRPYESPITGEMYNNYTDFITGAPTADGEPNTESSLQSDVWAKNGNFFFDVSANFAVDGSTDQAVDKDPTEVAEEDDVNTPNTAFGDTTEEADDDWDDDPFSISKEGEKINISEASKWLNDRGLTFEEASQVLEVNDVDGVFRKGLVYLNEAASVGTEFHEAFHAVFRSYLTDNQQDALIQEELARQEVTEEELAQLKEEGYFTLDEKGNLISRATKKELSTNQLNRLAIEERLAERFREYVQTNGTANKHWTARLKKFFKDVWNWLKTYTSNKRTVDQLFSNIESNMINKKYKNLRYHPDAFSIKKGFKASTVDQILKSINSQFIEIQDTITAKGEKEAPSVTYAKIRNRIYKAMFMTNDKQDVTLAQAKEAYGIMTDPEIKGIKKQKAFNDLGIKRRKHYKLLGKILKGWESTKDAKYGNVNKGWEYLAKQQLKDYGISVRGDLAASLDDTIDDKIHSKESVEESRKDTMSGEVKKFMSRIPALDKKGKNKEGIFGKGSIVYESFDSMYQSLALAVVDTTSFNDMLDSLINLSATKPELKSMVKELTKKIEAGDWKFIADFYKNMTMTYNNYISAIEELVVTEGEDGKKDVSIKVRYINSNNNKLTNVLTTRWRANARRSDDSGLYRKQEDGGYKTNKHHLNKLNENLKIVNQINSAAARVQPKHIEALANMAQYLGMENITAENLEATMEGGIRVDGRVIKDGEVFQYLKTGGKNKEGVHLKQIVNLLEKNIDAHQTEQSTFKRFVKVAEQFETENNGSFVNGAGKSIYPVNMHTTVSRMFGAFKNYNPEGSDAWKSMVESYKQDTLFFPDGAGADSEYNDVFMSEILNPLSDFRKHFNWQDFDVYKRKSESVSNNTYDTMSPMITKLNRMNAMLNNGNRSTQMVALPTMSDRNKLIFATIPRISYDPKLHGYLNKDVDTMLKGMIVQDLKSARNIRAEFNEAMSTGKDENLIVNLHYKKGKDKEGNSIKVIGNGVKFRQLSFLNKTEAGKALLKYNNSSTAERDMYTKEQVTDMYTAAMEDVNAYIENQVQEQLEKMEEFNIDVKTKKGKIKNPLDPNGMSLYDSKEEFLKDFIVSDMIAKNSFRKILGGDLGAYKSYENYSKRFGGLTTPGYETLEKDHRNTTYGDVKEFNMAIVNDTFTNRELDGYLEGVGLSEGLRKSYAKSNKTDAMGFTTLAKHRAKMQGQGTWTDAHEEAYKNYNATNSRGRNLGKPFRTNDGKYPYLTPIKTYHDGVYFKNGRMVRIMVKHSTMPLLREFTKSRPRFEALRNAMEQKSIDEVNMDSGVKVGGYGIIDMTNEGDFGFGKMTPIRLKTRNQRIPQVIPENKTKDGKIGSQLMKLVIANLERNFDGDYVLSTGATMKGKDLFNKYHDVMGALIKDGKTRLYNELGYDEYLKDKTTENKVKFLQRLRDVLSQSAMDRDLSDNYFKAVEIKDSMEFIDNVLTESANFSVPLSHPVYQGKFEQIIFSLFKNNMMNQTINGTSLVQIAELGGTKIDDSGDLKFVTSETITVDASEIKTQEDAAYVGSGSVVYKGDAYIVNEKKGNKVTISKIKHAEVAIPWSLAKEMGIPMDADGNFDLSNIEDKLRNMLGYRIPTQGKNSMLPLRIKEVLTPAQGKAILVPGEITTQMGSDFDIDKLFIMMRNHQIEYITDKGEKWDHVAAFKHKLANPVIGKNKKPIWEPFEVTDKQARKLLQDPEYANELPHFEYGTLTNSVAEASLWADKKREELGAHTPKAKTVKYNSKNLDKNSRDGLENLFIDLVESVLMNPIHTSEMLSPIDSFTLPDIAEFIKNKMGKGDPLDHNNVDTEETLETRNKVGKTGVGIWATASTGQAIRQSAPETAVSKDAAIRMDGKVLTNMAKSQDDLGNDISYLISKHLTISVDNANDPLMDFISDNAFTSPVSNLLISSGVSNKALAKVGKELDPKYLKDREHELTGDATEIAAYVRSQPIIQELISKYQNEDANPSMLYQLVTELGSEYDPRFVIGGKTSNVSSSKLVKNIGGEVKDDVQFQLDILNNFYHWHKAGRMLGKVNKILNADRISDMSSMAAIEEFLELSEEIHDPTRNDLITGFQVITKGDAYPITKHYLGALEDALSFASNFFPYKEQGIEAVKADIRKAVNTTSLNKDIIKQINKHSYLWMFSQPGSPFGKLFTDKAAKRLLVGKDSIDRRLDRIKRKVNKAEEGSELAALLDNTFLNRLIPHRDNFKVVEKKNKKGEVISTEDMHIHKTLSFDYSFSTSALEQSQLTEDFMELINSGNPDVAKFAKTLVYYTVLSKGFAPGVDTFSDIIPIEVWNDPQMSREANKQSMVQYYEENLNKFKSPTYWKGFMREFVENNVSLKGFIPVVDTLKGDSPTVRDNTAAYNRDLGTWAEYIRTFNHGTKKFELYKADNVPATEDTKQYVKVTPKAVDFKLNAYNMNKITSTPEEGKTTENNC